MGPQMGGPCHRRHGFLEATMWSSWRLWAVRQGLLEVPGRLCVVDQGLEGGSLWN